MSDTRTLRWPSQDPSEIDWQYSKARFKYRRGQIRGGWRRRYRWNRQRRMANMLCNQRHGGDAIGSCCGECLLVVRLWW